MLFDNDISYFRNKVISAGTREAREAAVAQLLMLAFSQGAYEGRASCEG